MKKATLVMSAVLLAQSAQAEPFNFQQPGELDRPAGTGPVSYLLICGHGVHTAFSKYDEPQNNWLRFDLQVLKRFKGGQVADVVIRTDDWDVLTAATSREWAKCP